MKRRCTPDKKEGGVSKSRPFNYGWRVLVGKIRWPSRDVGVGLEGHDSDPGTGVAPPVSTAVPGR